MSQTRLGSFAEACLNILVGFTINFVCNMLIWPFFGLRMTASVAFWGGVIFTVVSLIRQYIIRRWFNGLRFGNAPDRSQGTKRLATVRRRPRILPERTSGSGEGQQSGE